MGKRETTDFYTEIYTDFCSVLQHNEATKNN